jgi:uncharacterized protein YciI
MTHFVAINERGPAWLESVPMRQQPLWTEHANFVNSLMYAGFIVLGGPIGDGPPHRAMLIVDAESEAAARARLLEDPWMRAGILRISRIEPWTILVSHEILDGALAKVKALAPPGPPSSPSPSGRPKSPAGD